MGESLWLLGSHSAHSRRFHWSKTSEFLGDEPPRFFKSTLKSRSGTLIRTINWVWVKMKPPGIGPQVLVHVSTYQGKPFWAPVSDPQPNCGDGFAGSPRSTKKRVATATGSTSMSASWRDAADTCWRTVWNPILLSSLCFVYSSVVPRGEAGKVGKERGSERVRLAKLSDVPGVSEAA